MLDTLNDFYDDISIIDLFYLIITIFSVISCYKKGFVLSILSMAKWVTCLRCYSNHISEN